MCVIVAKDRGDKLPTKAMLGDCWDSNPDGAGFMWADPDNGTVHIRKGFMKWKKFWKAYRAEGLTEEHSIVYHFRITTAGGTKPANCHPFPISDKVSDLQALNVATTIGMAHNGIIKNHPRRKDISDTMEYTLEMLTEPLIYQNLDDPAVQKMIEKSIDGSRMAFLRPDGEILKVGNWELDGCLWVSNEMYKWSGEWGYGEMMGFTKGNVTKGGRVYGYGEPRYQKGETKDDEGAPINADDPKYVPATTLDAEWDEEDDLPVQVESGDWLQCPCCQSPFELKNEHVIGEMC